MVHPEFSVWQSKIFVFHGSEQTEKLILKKEAVLGLIWKQERGMGRFQQNRNDATYCLMQICLEEIIWCLSLRTVHTVVQAKAVMGKNICERSKTELLIHILMSKETAAFSSAYKIISSEFQTPVGREPQSTESVGCAGTSQPQQKAKPSLAPCLHHISALWPL